MSTIIKQLTSQPFSILAFVFMSFLTACSQPIPSAQQSYIGYWEGGDGEYDVKLLIQPSSYVVFERSKVADRGRYVHPTRITGNIIEFIGEDFRVGAVAPGVVFDVHEVPVQTGETWTMNLDGFVLTKVADNAPSKDFISGENSHPSDEFDGLYDGKFSEK